ncbi:MAG: hypothetical protein ABID61_02640 [Candidatus Micrarchaeota archaeon]
MADDDGPVIMARQGRQEDTTRRITDAITDVANTAIDRSYSKNLELAITGATKSRTSPEDATARMKMVVAARESNHDAFLEQARTLGMNDASAIETLWTQCLEITQQSKDREPKMRHFLVDGHERQDNNYAFNNMTRIGVLPEVAYVATVDFYLGIGEHHAIRVNDIEKRITPEKGLTPDEIMERDTVKIAAFAAGNTAVAFSHEHTDIAPPLDKSEVEKGISVRMADGLDEQQLGDLMGALAGIVDHSTLNYLGEKYQIQSLSRELIQNNCQTFLTNERNARDEKERQRLYDEFAKQSGDKETVARLYQYYQTETTQGRDDVVVAVLADHAVARWYLDNGYPSMVIPSRKSPTEIA